MEVKAYSTLSDANLQDIVKLYLQLERIERRVEKLCALRQLVDVLELGWKSRMSREIRDCFRARERRRMEGGDRMGRFISAVSFALKDRL
eukprot:1361024-Amorphochlora_amoeboformis.AAC.1